MQLLEAARRVSAPLPGFERFTAKQYFEAVENIEVDLGNEVVQAIEHYVATTSPLLTTVDLERRTKRELIDLYSTSARYLHYAQGHWAKFCNVLVSSQIECRGNGHSPDWSAPIAESKKAITDAIEFQRDPGAMLLSADFAVHSERLMANALRADLKSRATAFAKHCAGVLKMGAEKNWLGLVTWLDPQTARYTYSTAPIICLGKAGSRRERAGDVIRIRDSWDFQHRQGIHEHHLIQARCLPGMPKKLLVPPRLHELLDSIPQMLQPTVSMVDGVLIAERVIEWDLFRSVSESERTIPAPIMFTKWDPALCIGPFVIAGWTERDFPNKSRTLWQFIEAWRRDLHKPAL